MDFFRKASKPKLVDPLEPIPVGDAQESDWGAWDDLVASQDHPNQTPAGLKQEEPNSSIEQFNSVTKNSG